MYVEDDPQTLEDWLEFMREQDWSGDCRGVRSLEAARELVEDGKYRPSFVIHDCQPLECEDDEVDSEEAGDDLYAFFVEERIPVVVLSGANEATKLQAEPYRSNPPLKWIDKPVEAAKILEAVEAYREWKHHQQ
jgi:hypothetical protein